MICSCQSDQPKPKVEPAPYTFDFEAIKKRGHLVALVDNSTTSYFTYKGQPMGFEYEMLKRFADSKDLTLEVKVVYNLDNVLEMLDSGEGDIVAANITVTGARAKQVAFSSPLLKTKQVLVQNRSSQDMVRELTELEGRTVHVRKGSAFYDRLLNVEEEIGGTINIVALSDSGESSGMNKTLQLIDQVAKGEVEITVADENIARVEKKLKPELDINTAISFPQNVAWAMRQSDTNLKKMVDMWLEKEKKRNDYYTIYTKYFKARTKLKEKLKSDYSSMSGGISPYDKYIKTYAVELDWDWRLLASQIYQESKFDPNAQAWTGATGLMQLLPTTAEEHGIDSSQIRNPEANIRAGVSYLKWLNKAWSHTIEDSVERAKFVLASFNVGLGHIIDARNLARKYGADPTLWDENVARFIVLKSQKEYYSDEVCKHGYCRGQEPYNYVKEVMDRYGHYLNLIPE